MRELKFRFYSADAEEYFDVVSIDFEDDSFTIRTSIYKGFMLHKIDGLHQLEQFTGLCDKNGKEVYEGDIVRYVPEVIADSFWRAHPDGRHDSIVEMTLDEDYEFGVDFISLGLNHPISECSIIGTIHDNIAVSN